MAVPTPTKLTTAIGDMETAYMNATGRTIPDYVNLKSGSIGGETLTPGLYKWGTTSHMEGIILSQTQIIVQTSASIKGRLLAQSQVSLDAATVVQPAL